MAYTFDTEQARNAETIVRVGRALGAPAHLIRAALAAAWTESKWHNLGHGDRDSVGLFQQRPSMGWGSAAELMIPETAARKFFLGAGTNKGAFAVSGAGTPGQVAQRVQRSAFPDRYDAEIGATDEMLQRLGGGGGLPALGGDTNGLAAVLLFGAAFVLLLRR